MKIIIKLNKRHPLNYMYFGRHTITYQPQTIVLNKEEEKLLDTDGPKAWFSVEHYAEERTPVKKVTKKKTTKRLAK